MPTSTLLLLTFALLAVALDAKVFPVTDDAATRARLTEQVEDLMSLTDEQARDLVPTASGGIYFTDCPNCEFGAEESYCFDSTWDPRHPKQITCVGCGAVYPNNPEYPDDKYLEVAAPDGEPHRFYYWEREDGYKTFFRAHADYLAREWLQDRCRDLGDLYFLTGDAQYASRATVILERFAEVYPGWATIFDYPFREKLIEPWHVTRIEAIAGFEDYRNSRWTWWAYMDIPLELLQGYDGIQGWDGLTAERRDRIENDLFRSLIEFVLDMEEDYTNMSMGMWRSAIYAGRVLSKPGWIHDAVRRFEHLLETRFLYDGHWMETSDSYAAQTDGGLRVVMQATDGYSDPPGYVDPVDGRRFDDLDLRQVAPGFEAQALTVGAVRFPDNRLLPANDTWEVHGKASRYWRARTREAMSPALLPATGVAVLGGGTGEQQLHAYLNHTMGQHHKHYDALSFGLYANGRELVPDIGYTWTSWRLHWPTRTMSHNTVVVNGVDSGYDRDHTRHRLREFAAFDGFQVTGVDALSAYPTTDRYRRTLALVGHDSADAYLLDVFEVNGGQQHDWLLLGSVDEDSTASVAGATLRPFAGTLVNEGIEFAKPRDFGSPNPPGHAFGFWEQLQAGLARQDVIALTTRLEATPELGLRTLLAPGEGATVYLAQVPSIRRAEESNAKLEADKGPAFCVRRTGEALASRFVAVHEPLRGEPRVESLAVTEQDRCLIAEIRHRDGVDWYLQALDDEATTTVATDLGPLTFDGAWALLRLTAEGAVGEAHLIGQRLAVGAVELTAGGWSGTVTGVGRDASEGSRGWVEVDQRIETDAHGTLILRFADQTIRPFNLVRREPIAGGTRLYVREDPALVIGADAIELVSFPPRTIPGTAMTWSLAGTASTKGMPAPPA